jgi:hypothetical protein
MATQRVPLLGEGCKRHQQPRERGGDGREVHHIYGKIPVGQRTGLAALTGADEVNCLSALLASKALRSR